MTRVVEITRSGPPEVLQVRERPALEGATVDVRAAGVNFADVHARMGIYPDAPPIPFVPGYEVAGVERGTGRRVLAAVRFGGYASEVAAPRENLFEIPEGLSFEEAAAIPVNYMTAWVALMEMGRVREGDDVTLHSAAGGVGIAAIQIAKHAGANVAGVVGTEEKAAYLRTIGVTPVVRPAEPPKADIILDPRSPAAWRDSFNHLKRGGRVILYGAQEFATGKRANLLAAAWKFLRIPKVNPVKLMNANKGVFGINMLHLMDDMPMLKRAMAGILQGARDGWVRPKVDRAFPFDRAAEAHHYLQDRKNIGKVLLVP